MSIRRVAGPRLAGVVVLTVVTVLVVVVVAMVAAPAGNPAAVAPTTVAPVTAGPTTIVDNEFIPEDRNLSDCVSALPQPGCGSKARGGWRQTLVFGVLALGLALIAWRIVRGVRRRDRVA